MSSSFPLFIAPSADLAEFMLFMQKLREDCEDASNELMLVDDAEVRDSLALKMYNHKIIFRTFDNTLSNQIEDLPP